VARAARKGWVGTIQIPKFILFFYFIHQYLNTNKCPTAFAVESIHPTFSCSQIQNWFSKLQATKNPLAFTVYSVGKVVL
jgi:hypothetical protein